MVQVAVLAGDYLLARASVLLASLGNVDVVQVMASALDALVQGEIMQIKSQPEDMLEMAYYLRKSYYKTASLICDACKVSPHWDWNPSVDRELFSVNCDISIVTTRHCSLSKSFCLSSST